MKKNTFIPYLLLSLISFGCSERVTNIYQNNETKEVLTIEDDSLKQKDRSYQWLPLIKFFHQQILESFLKFL